MINSFEPGVYITENAVKPFTIDTLNEAVAQMKANNVLRIGESVYVKDEILVNRFYLRDDPLVDDRYLVIGDGFVDVKVKRDLPWWNRFWCERAGVPISEVHGVDVCPEIGRYKVYNMDETWLYCRWESAL